MGEAIGEPMARINSTTYFSRIQKKGGTGSGELTEVSVEQIQFLHGGQ